MNKNSLELSVSEFVYALNQTLEYAYGSIVIYGELANFKVTKNQWVFFDLLDGEAKVHFFGTVYNLPGPLEDGVLLKVRGTPKHHLRYGFSISVQTITPYGEGSIKKISELLMTKLQKEGLFNPSRKRLLPSVPQKIGLITSKKSAAYSDFIKILNNRWVGLDIECFDVLVQGDLASSQIINAIEYFSRLSELPDVLVIVRGGGSSDDLSVFNDEQLTRSVSASRVPTMVAIGHEIDISLAELAADVRASTPSNAAELIVPDKKVVLDYIAHTKIRLEDLITDRLKQETNVIDSLAADFLKLVEAKIKQEANYLNNAKFLLDALSPKEILKRGYAIVRHGNKISDGIGLKLDDIVSIEMKNNLLSAKITANKEV